MSILDKAVKLKNENTRPFITLRERFITFSKTAIEQLEYSPLINILILKEDKKVAFQVCDDPNDADALTFYKERSEGKQLLVRVSSKRACTIIAEIAGLKQIGSEGVRFYGEYLKEDRAILIDLSKPE